MAAPLPLVTERLEARALELVHGVAAGPGDGRDAPAGTMTAGREHVRFVAEHATWRPS